MDAAVNAIATFFSFVFLVLQIHFWGQGDSHMMTLMCGMCLLCVGLRAGWSLAGKMRGGDVE